MSTNTIISKTTLHDGYQMPKFGFGCFDLGSYDVVVNAVNQAIKSGYRLFDSASYYGNEEAVGKTLRESGLKREDYFVVSKLRPDCHGYEEAKKRIRESFDKLDLGYIDLHLIHSSRGGQILETWKAFIELKNEGLIRSIGVSNFNIQHIQPIIDNGMELPAVNQIELNPWHQQKGIVEFCEKHNIAVMGYCPLARNKFWSRSPIIEEIGNKYNKTKQQVALKWALQRNFITIPRSSNNGRIIENSLLFDWSLNEDDIHSINQLDEDLICSYASEAMSEPFLNPARVGGF